MKDPIVLCFACGSKGRRVRKLFGVRCPNSKCAAYGALVATDPEIIALRAYARSEEDRILFEWARSCQVPINCCVRPPTGRLTEPPIL